MKRLALILCLGILLGMAPMASAAETIDNKGLQISPLRYYVTLNAGEQKTGNLVVANQTDKPMTITLSLQQFSVADYSYDYRFKAPTNDWLKLEATQITLQPHKSRTVMYQIFVPSPSPSGGYYYTLLASTEMQTGGLTSTVQAASLIYVTVNGELVRASEFKSSSLQHVSFGGPIRYTMAVKNTGNVHYFAYFSGKLQGRSARDIPGTSHLLLPGAIRQVSGSMPAPLLPGIYRATYSYTTDTGTILTRTGRVVFIPPWSIALPLALILLGSFFYRRRKKHSQKIPAAQVDET